jgi:hypothetical protein
MIENITFLQFLTATLIIETFMMILFRFTKTSKAINNWYNNLGWTAVILDVLSILIGFYIAKFIYEYLVEQKYINTEYELYKYLGLVLMVQIIHDFSFYFFVIKPYPKFKNKVIDEFKEYAKYYKSQSVFADSLIYIATTPILYYLVVKNSNDTNIFINLVGLYLIGYFLYQKPVIKM